MKNHDTVLAVYASWSGLSYVAFEGPHILVDWGSKASRGPNKNVECLKGFTKIVEMLRPTAIVIDSCGAANVHRSKRICRLNRSLIRWSASKGIKVYCYSRDEVRDTFADTGAFNKDQIAAEVAKRLPELEPRRPRERKPWMNEHPNMGLFDAAALGFTYYRLFPKGRVRRTRRA